MAFDVRRFDIYRKVPKDLTQPTYAGAVISVCCVLFIIFLLLSEFSSFISPEISSELFVDDPNKHHDRIPVRLNISVPHLKCEHAPSCSLVVAVRPTFQELAPSDKTESYKNYGGDEGYVNLQMVPGNFHVSTHAAGHSAGHADIPNFQHVVHELSFGDSLKGKRVPGSYNPITSVMHAADDPSANHEYVIKIVPTLYEDLRGNSLAAYQYTYAHKSYPTYGQMIPAVWFRYDLTPITVKYTEKRPPFYTFLTTVCAIVGGTFTVAGILDSLTFSASEMIRKKIT